MTGPLSTMVLACAACLPLASKPGNDAGEPEGPLAALAGDYGYGDGFSYHLVTVTREGRFSSEEGGCLGVYDCNAGRAEVVAGRLLLTPDRIHPGRVGLYLRSLAEALCRLLFPEPLADGEGAPRDRQRLAADLRYFGEGLRESISEYRAGAKPIELVPIRWGERLQLVPPEDGPAYCNLVNLGWVARYPGRCFYLRAGDAEHKVEGLPSVPEEWRPMLLKAPLHGRITEVLADGRARVDLGTEDGVWKGMRLDTDAGDVRAVEVTATSAVIERDDDRQPPFQKGQGLRSRERGLE